MMYKKIIGALLINLGLFANICNAQDDNTKSFLFLSVFCEEADTYYEQSSDILKRFNSLYENFSYECTKPITIPVSKIKQDSLMDYEKYNIQLFKIRKSHIPSYYIMRLFACDTYKFSFREDIWIRISGYKESDLKVFFDALIKRGMKKLEIQEMVDIWRNSDEMFREIDWDCLMDGYYNNNTHFSCYVSGTNLWYKARYLGGDDDIYAVFSKKILAGTLFKFD